MAPPNRMAERAAQRDRILDALLKEEADGQLSPSSRLHLAEILTLRCIEDSLDTLKGSIDELER